MCNKCGGSGDLWDASVDDWTTPRRYCDGSGYAIVHPMSNANFPRYIHCSTCKRTARRDDCAGWAEFSSSFSARGLFAFLLRKSAACPDCVLNLSRLTP